MARREFGNDTHLILGGSKRACAETRDSDRDYQMTTPAPVSRAGRKRFVSKLQEDPVLGPRYSVVAKTDAIKLIGVGVNPDLDIVPVDVAYTQRTAGFLAQKEIPPTPPEFAAYPGAQKAASFLKKKEFKG